MSSNNYNYRQITNSYMINYCNSLVLELDWNAAEINSWKQAFVNKLNLQECNLIDFYGTPDLSYIFAYCSYLTNLDVSNWNTSNITNLNYAFLFCSNLKTLDVSNWNTNNISNLAKVFSHCNNLTTLDVSNWNISNVTNLSHTFEHCYNLTTLDVSNWNTSKIIDLSYAFFNCYNLTTLDVSNWKINNITNMESVFSQCNNLTTLDVSNWNMNNVKSLRGTFYGCNNLTTLDVSNWNTSNVTDMSWTFSDCLRLKNISNVMTNWNTANVIRMHGLFSEGWGSIDPYGKDIINLSNWNTTKLESCYNTFAYCLNLKTVWINNWDMRNITETSGMFAQCNNLKNINTSNWNLCNCKYMSCMFMNCYNLTNLDTSNWNISKVNSLYRIFDGCHNLANLNISNWDVSKVNNLAGVFNSCWKLTILNLLNWNTNNVIDMSCVFSFCSDLTDLNLSTWDINNVQNISQMFSGTGSGNWNCNYSNDYAGVQYFGGVTFNFIPYWNFSNITNMAYFLNNANCGYIPLYSVHEESAIESFNMINIDWHTDKVVNIAYAFAFNSYLPYWYYLSDWASYNMNGPDGQANWFFNFNNVINAQGAFSANSYWVTRVEDTDFSDVEVMGADYLLYLNNTEKIINAQSMFAMDKNCNSNFETNELWYQYAIPTFNIQTSILNLNNAVDVSKLFYNYQPIVTNWGNGTWDYDNGRWDWWPTSNSMKKTLPTLILNNVQNLYRAYYNTRTTIDTTYWNLSKVTNIAQVFSLCNALDSASLKNIANALLTATSLSTAQKNLFSDNSKSPFYMCNKYISNTTIGTTLGKKLADNGWIVPNA